MEPRPNRKFDHCEYLKKDKGHQTRHYSGSVVFDTDKKAIEFLDQKDAMVVLIPNYRIRDLFYETKIPALPFHAHSVTDFFIISYADSDGKSKSIVINMDKCKHFDIVTEAAAATGKSVSYARDRCCVW